MAIEDTDKDEIELKINILDVILRYMESSKEINTYKTVELLRKLLKQLIKKNNIEHRKTIQEIFFTISAISEIFTIERVKGKIMLSKIDKILENHAKKLN
jgi:hypothetical protein